MKDSDQERNPEWQCRDLWWQYEPISKMNIYNRSIRESQMKEIRRHSLYLIPSYDQFESFVVIIKNMIII